MAARGKSLKHSCAIAQIAQLDDIYQDGKSLLTSCIVFLKCGRSKEELCLRRLEVHIELCYCATTVNSSRLQGGSAITLCREPKMGQYLAVILISVTAVDSHNSITVAYKSELTVLLGGNAAYVCISRYTTWSETSCAISLKET